jgi:septal ring factor EnvC (AmiA/AmiB activator)
MTPDRRLDQLEPLMAEHSAQLDLHTAQLRRIAGGIQLVTESISQQSDNVTFLLKQQAEMKGDLEQIRQVQTQQTETLNTILNILQGRSDN